ncbi:MAG TPA: TadE family protein [Phycisphaerae bacterium]|nr:TadE family protein [Phycisphaerae bacterium]
MPARNRTTRLAPPGAKGRLHARGTALIEFILVIPVLGAILALTFFFGWALLHKHQMVVADRYAAWRRIETGTWPTTVEINEGCLGNRGYNVSLNGSRAGMATPQDLADETADVHDNAGRLADELIVQRFPSGRRAHVTAEFPARKALWEAVMADRPTFHARHSREGLTWRCDEAVCWSTLRDQFYDDLDNGLTAVPDPGDGMAQMIRSLYLAHWPDKAKNAQ